MGGFLIRKMSESGKVSQIPRFSGTGNWLASRKSIRTRFPPRWPGQLMCPPLLAAIQNCYRLDSQLILSEAIRRNCETHKRCRTVAACAIAETPKSFTPEAIV